VINRITWAEGIYSDAGDKILDDPVVKDLIKRLKEKIVERKRQMIICGMRDICKRCEEEEGGSCCGKGLEDRYNEWMLLINKLLGCELPHERYKPDSCFFLGKDGCVLMAPHVLCINYICKKIENTIPKDKLVKLRNIEGEMIELIFKLHEYLIKIAPTLWS